MTIIQNFFSKQCLLSLCLLCTGFFSLMAHGQQSSINAAEPDVAQNTGAASISPATSAVEPSTTPPLTTSPVTDSPSTSPTGGAASAPAPAPAYGKGAIGSGAHLASVTFALVGIVALIFAVSWFIRRFGQGIFTPSEHMKIIASMPLGTREKLLLVDVAGKQILLGVTGSQINKLHVFDEPVVLRQDVDRSSDFSKKLMAILQQKNTLGQSPNKNSSGQE